LFSAFFSYLVIVIFLKNRSALIRLFFSLGWMVISAAAFLFYRFDPASSRVLHLYSVGLCLGISFLIFDGIFLLRRKNGNLFGIGCITLIIFYYSFLLFQHIGKYQYAADSALLIQKQLVDLYKSDDSSGTIFLLDYPAYIYDQSGKVNLAPRYQIGISDALDRPFVKDKARVYPSPKLNLSELRPLFLLSEKKTFCSWNEESQLIQVLSFGDFKGDNLPEIEVLCPEDHSLLDNNNLKKDIVFKTGPYRNFSLVILTDLIPIKHRFTIMESNSGVVHVNLFTEPKLFPFRFYGREKVYWWISAIDANGLVVAQSKLRSFVVKRDR